MKKLATVGTLKGIALAGCLMICALAARAQGTNSEWNLADFPIVSPPPVGTFWLWSSYGKFGQDVFGPPLPFNPYGTNVTIYGFTNTEANALQFMIDDTPVVQAQAEAAAPGLHLNGVGAMSEDEGGGMEPMGAPSYPSNALWIELMAVSNATVYVNLHGTIESQTYQLLSRDTLDNTNQWAQEGAPVIGASGQDWTPATVAVGTRTNTLFLWAMSYVDTDGDGLPDWWELQNGLDPNSADTGNTGVPDGYKDLAGDGWTTLYKYEHGYGANQFSTPPPPKNVAAHAAPDGTNVVITWESGGGPVSYYTVRWGSGDIGTNTPDVLTFTDDNGGWPLFGTLASPRSYQIRAHFADGSYSESPWVGVSKPGLTPDTAIVWGQQNAPFLAAGYISPEMSTLRISYDYTDWTTGNNVHAWVDLYPSNFVNGIAPWPAALYPALNNSTYIQATGTDGSVGDVRYPYDIANYNYTEVMRATNYINDALQSKENLKFLLASATMTRPFSYASSAYWPYSIYDGGWDESYISDPSTWYARSPSSTNYEYYGFHTYSTWAGYSVLQEQRPLREHYLWRNFMFDPGYFDMTIYSGFPADYPINGIGIADDGTRGIFVQSLDSLTGGSSFPLAFNVNGTSEFYIYYAAGYEFDDPDFDLGLVQDMGLAQDPVNGVYLPAGRRNLYGLPIQTVRVCPYLDNQFVLTPASAPTWPSSESFLYTKSPAPELQITDYYFASQTPYLNYRPYTSPYGSLNPAPPLPGAPTFSTANSSALLIAPIGQSYVVSGWAKMAIDNGYSDKFAYLEQYFDKAYKIDTNGAVTSNETGVLSPYGEFFPTEPGPTALVTMADIDTGERGTGVVNVIKLQLDVNHDGNMDLSFGGPDNTSQSRPFRFWVNGDYDFSSGSADPMGHDVNNTGYRANYMDGGISCPRDLEDFARLWICGLPALTNGYHVTLSWGTVSSGSPAINLVNAVETNGGTFYLTDSNTAIAQCEDYMGFGPGQKHRTISPTNAPLTLASSLFTNTGNKYFLFEGAGIGSGELVLTISQTTPQGSNIIARTSAWFDLHDIKDFYERAVFTNYMNGAVSTWASGVLPIETASASAMGDDTNLIVFVHGINVGIWDWFQNSETSFKRFYWQGYQGKFASVKWPCNYLTPPNIWDPAVFNLSELKAYKSSAAMKDYLVQLRNRFPGYHLNVFVHSQGNAVVSEAIRQGAPFDTYILTQAAVPASAYDVNAFTNTDLTDREFGPYITPDWQPLGYHGAYTNLSGGKIVNFYNPRDGVLSIWLLDQKLIKPSQFYSYDGTNCWYLIDSDQGLFRRVTDTQESRSMISRSRTWPLGMQGPPSPPDAQGVISDSDNLAIGYGFYDSIAEHSAEFTRPIQTVWRYYRDAARAFAP